MQSLAVIGAVGVVAMRFATPEIAMPALGAWGAGALLVLFVVALRCEGTPGGRPFGSMAAHLLTATRGITAGILLAAAPWIGRSWPLVVALLAVELSDFFDGRLARASGSHPFGAVWDMENDAFFTLALSITVWLTTGVGAFVLLIGLMRYLYFVLFRTLGDPPQMTRAAKLFAKTVAASLVLVQIAVLAPGLPATIASPAIAAVLALQLLSFGSDVVVRMAPSPVGA